MRFQTKKRLYCTTSISALAGIKRKSNFSLKTMRTKHNLSRTHTHTLARSFSLKRREPIEMFCFSRITKDKSRHSLFSQNSSEKSRIFHTHLETHW